MAGRVLVLLGGVVAAVLAGAALAAYRDWTDGGAADVPPPATEGEALRALAERMLTTPWPGAGPEVRVELLPGRLPEDLPVRVPVPPGAGLLGTVVSTGVEPAPATAAPRTPQVGTQVFMDLPATVQAAAQLFDAELKQQGWEPLEEPPPSGGFWPRVTRRYCNPETAAGLVTVEATPDRRGGSQVRLGVARPEPSGLCGKLAPRPPASATPGGDVLIPPLRLPDRARLTAGSGVNPAGNRFQTAAMVETAMAVGELEQFLAGQLQRAGWRLLDRNAAEGAAWSRWTIPTAPDWWGVLLVVAAPAEGVRLLQVNVASAEEGGSIIPGTGSPAPPGGFQAR